MKVDKADYTQKEIEDIKMQLSHMSYISPTLGYNKGWKRLTPKGIKSSFRVLRSYIRIFLLRFRN